MDVSLRQAVPEDAEVAGFLVYQAAPDIADYLFGFGDTGGVDFVRYDFGRPGGFFACDTTLCACESDQPVAICSLFPPGEYRKRYLRTVLHALTFFPPWRLPAVLARAARLDPVIPTPPKDAMYMAFTAVEERFRRRGLASRLLRQALERGSAAGFARAVLDVSVNNPEMQRIVRRFGFEKVGTGRMHRGREDVKPYDRYIRSLGE